MPTTSQPINKNAQIVFSSEEVRNISGLGDVLRQIRTRLKSEGVELEDERQKLLKYHEVQKTE